jgi:hypothetical protein
MSQIYAVSVNVCMCASMLLRDEYEPTLTMPALNSYIKRHYDRVMTCTMYTMN